MNACAEETVNKRPANTTSQHVPDEKYKQKLLEDIYNDLADLEPQEIEKLVGLHVEVSSGHKVYTSGGKPLESLGKKDLEVLKVKVEQAVDKSNANDRRVQEENRKAIQDMMDARRLAEENNNRLKR